MTDQTRTTLHAFVTAALIASFAYGIVLTAAGYLTLGAIMTVVPVAVILPKLIAIPFQEQPPRGE
jgi:MFS superfamily sulfate permease-like transporter